MDKEKQEQIKSIQNEKRLKIIGSIAENGLLTPQESYDKGLKVSSASESAAPKEKDKDKIYGTVYIPESTKGVKVKEHTLPFQDDVILREFSYKNPDNPEVSLSYKIKEKAYQEQGGNKARLQEILYNVPQFSLLPVVSERQDESLEDRVDSDNSEIEDRMKNSFIVVSKMESLDELNGGDGEAYLTQSLSPDKIAAVIFPVHLSGEASQFSKQGIPIIPVEQVSADVTIKQGMFGEADEVRTLEVPDYETWIGALAEKLDQPLFLHIVRLPTLDDSKDI